MIDRLEVKAAIVGRMETLIWETEAEMMVVGDLDAITDWFISEFEKLQGQGKTPEKNKNAFLALDKELDAKLLKGN